MSYTASLHHIVFSTHFRARTINPAVRDNLIDYIGGIVKNKKSKLLAANCMPEHVHLLVDIGPEMCMSQLVGAVKQSTSVWLKSPERSPKFFKWAKEYYACSISPAHKESVMKYIINQELHHGEQTFDDELTRLLCKAGLTMYPRSFMD